jgi:hypothetical protein
MSTRAKSAPHPAQMELCIRPVGVVVPVAVARVADIQRQHVRAGHIGGEVLRELAPARHTLPQ